MKKLLLFILISCLAATLLCSCSEPASGGCSQSYQHKDKDDNGKCDECGADFEDGDETAPCEHKDADDNEKCDACGADFEDGCDNHKDADDNEKCDACGADFEDGCDNHKDADDNGKCDACGADFEDGCDNHKDADDNGECDNGGEDFEDGCDNHRDADDNEKCDECGADFEDGKEPTLIYDKSNIPTMISKKGDISYVLDELREAHSIFNANTSIRPGFLSDSSAVSEHEIVFGDTSREITAVAKDILLAKLSQNKEELLDRCLYEEDIAGFLIYSDGSSVAIVWTHFQIAPLAVDYFLKTYANESELWLAEGYEKSDFLSLDGYLTEREEKIHAEKWAALEAAVPEKYRADFIKELKLLYSLYDDNAVYWLASLYDVETGGWYNSKSAQRTEGYGPDIENTYYGLTMMGYSGMAELFDGDWSKAVPYDILEKAALWIKSLQDPDGYFYHPQWPKSYIEANNRELRITRDKGSANTILKKAGITATYSGYSPSTENLLGNLGQSTVVAVSKPVYISSILTQYESLENFRAYLAEQEESLKTMSDSERASFFYSFGSRCSSGLSLIKPEMRPYLIEFFDKYQNPNNGMWSENLYANSTNALHKIGAVYNGCSAEFKHVDKMALSTLEILMWDVKTKPISATCDLYNVWSCFHLLYTNIRKAGSGTAAEREARCEEIKTLVYEQIAEAIHVTYEQMVDFLIPSDGSFSYYRNNSCTSMQGCPSAVPGTKEGDVNGYLIATFDMPIYILRSLELYDDYNVPLYTEQDRVRYIHGIRNAKTVEKGTVEVTEVVTYGFEGDAVGDKPEGIRVTLDAGRVLNPNSFVKVSDDGTGNKVLEFNATARTVSNGRNESAIISAGNADEKPNVLRLEFTLKLNTKTANNRIFDMLFRASGSSSTVMQVYFQTDAFGNIYFYEQNGTKVGKVGKAGEYIDIAIEHEWSKGEYRIYSAGKLVGTGSSTYSNNPHVMTGSVLINSGSTVTANYYLDNICVKTYKKAD